MNRLGDIGAKQIILGMVALFVLVVVVMGATGQFEEFEFLANLLPSFEEDFPEGEYILGYNLLEAELVYYNGIKWNEIDVSQDTFVLGDYEFNPGEVKNDFEEFYYENREVPFEIKGAGPDNIISNDPQDDWLKQSQVMNLKKYSLGDLYPENLKNQHGAVLGSLKILEKFVYIQRFFLLTQKNEFYKTTKSDEFIQVGKLSSSIITSPMDDDRYLSDSVFLIHFFQGILFENSQTNEAISLIQGKLLEIDNFYLADDFGSPEERIEKIYTKSGDGKKWIYYNDKKLNVYISGKEVYALAGKMRNFVKSNNPNEQVLIEKVIRWRDSVFQDAFVIEFKKNKMFICTEKIDEYMVANLANEVSEGVTC